MAFGLEEVFISFLIFYFVFVIYIFILFQLGRNRREAIGCGRGLY